MRKIYSGMTGRKEKPESEGEVVIESNGQSYKKRKNVDVFGGVSLCDQHVQVPRKSRVCGTTRLRHEEAIDYHDHTWQIFIGCTLPTFITLNAASSSPHSAL
jgi:hypothetical protein